MNNSAFAIYIFILLNYILYGLGFLVPIETLYLNHSSPEFYQFVTAFFCHVDFQHLSGNMFFIYFFGKLIEEEIGTRKFTLFYLCTGILTNGLHYLFVNGNVHLAGASGVLFGLFAVALIIKMKDDWRSWIEILVLTPFVFSYLITEFSSLGKFDQISHTAHLLGAASGVACFFPVKKLNV